MSHCSLLPCTHTHMADVNQAKCESLLSPGASLSISVVWLLVGYVVPWGTSCLCSVVLAADHTRLQVLYTAQSWQFPLVNIVCVRERERERESVREIEALIGDNLSEVYVRSFFHHGLIHSIAKGNIQRVSVNLVHISSLFLSSCFFSPDILAPPQQITEPHCI